MNTLATEFGGTVPHSLSEYYRGGGLVPNAPVNSAVPTSGTIALGNFYGATSRVPIVLPITSNTFNYDVFANAAPAYNPGISDITVTVSPGVIVGSTSTGAYAMLVPGAFSPTDTVTIVNNGVIQGMGGDGGPGGVVISTGPFGNASRPGNPGSGGGNALYINRPTVITNNGVVAGGGGGGGGGGAITSTDGATGGSGGGGGAGFNGGGGGAGGPAFHPGGGPPQPGNPGSPGTSSAGGAGGPPIVNVNFPGGAGGVGGGRGASGSPGGATANRSGGSGAGAGNYIVGNPFVTWPVTGTRQGGVA